MELSFVLVGHDLELLDTLRLQLEREGQRVRVFSSSLEALESATVRPPDCLVTDLSMPQLSGVELTQKLRSMAGLASTKIVVLSDEICQSERDSALESGADGFFSRASNDRSQILSEILAVVSERIRLKFWGCRGTIPVPGPGTLKYGGNTSCVSMTFPNDHVFIFDAGTGIKPLADSLMAIEDRRLVGTIFFTHPHWDHINFIPFFSPFFVPGNRLTLVGSPVQGQGIEQLVNNQMGGVHFPITTSEFCAQVHYQDVDQRRYRFGPAEVETMVLEHPGHCLGYSVFFGGKKICYVTDNELFPEDSDRYNPDYVERLLLFVKEADVLIIDTTYFDDEYLTKVGWGHSGVSAVCRLAHQGMVKDLYLFHHDPGQDDEALERKLALGQRVLARLGSTVRIRLALAEEEVVLQRPLF